MTNFVPTVCPYCGTGCGMLLVERDGKLIGTEPWPRHPVSEGKLCIRGWNAHQFVHHQERLTKPLIKKDGVFVETSWDEAFSLTAEKFGSIKKDFGADALAVLTCARATNEDNYLVQKFTRTVLGTNNVDHCARL